ncbi:sigma-70 family RNA polymerase sigma factor [Maribacter sp. R77961]|uniref:sigma-70 family RNA polymerase sigma factor n=1 Tax=Maribacter sp. R77961 TaxID=3093871 RepID=UPI0037C69B2C
MSTAKTIINADKWIENYQTYLFNYAKLRIHNRLDVEEIIQDTFLAAWKSKDKFQNRSSERTWLTAILKHKIIDYYRRKSSKKGKIERYSLSHDEYRDNYHYDVAISQPEECILSNVNLENVERLFDDALKHIPDSQSKVLRLRVYDQMNTEEICDKLDISKNNAWVLMCRARKTIATHFAKYDYAV